MIKYIQYVLSMVLIALARGDNDKIKTVIIDIPSGQLKGLESISKPTGKTVYEFRGIPFAKPPVDKLRFKKPVPFGNWHETLDATVFGAGCPQYIPDHLHNIRPSKMSEDCLVLNVYVPVKIEANRKLSVMMWIHGGAFILGHAHQYDGGWMATEGNVIVVTVNYRLDIFGFLALNHQAAKGNFGLWDQKLALEWIHDNIGAFGGNKESVTIFGESAGGMCASYQSVIPSNRGLFQRIISMSGVLDRGYLLTNKKIKEVVKDLANKTLCSLDDMYKFVDCLREMPFDDLLQITNGQGTNNQISFQAKFHPVVDGELYEVHPISRLEDSASEEASFFKSLDFMTGLTSNEGSILFMMVTPLVQYHYDLNLAEGIPSSFVCEGMVSPYVELHFKGSPEIEQQLCDFYTVNTSHDDQSLRATDFIGDISFGYSTMKMLEYHASLGGRSFQYLFSKLGDFHPMGPSPSWFKGCGHGEDLQHFFDFSSMAPPTTDGDLDGKEKEFSRQVIRYWTSFAKSGQPDGGEGSVPWKEFELTERNYLDLDITTTQKKDWNPDMVEFWSKKLPPIEIEPVTILVHDEL